MSTKQLKILIAIMLGMILFIIGYGYGTAKGEGPLQATTSETLVEEVDDEVKQEETIIYTWEMKLDELVEKVNALVGNYDISRAIVNECTTQAFDNYEQCLKAIVGVANAESSLFTKGMQPSNNGFGLMYKGKIIGEKELLEQIGSNENELIVNRLVRIGQKLITQLGKNLSYRA